MKRVEVTKFAPQALSSWQRGGRLGQRWGTEGWESENREKRKYKIIQAVIRLASNDLGLLRA